jgi:hypothetical protein
LPPPGPSICSCPWGSHWSLDAMDARQCMDRDVHCRLMRHIASDLRRLRWARCVEMSVSKSPRMNIALRLLAGTADMDSSSAYRHSHHNPPTKLKNRSCVRWLHEIPSPSMTTLREKSCNSPHLIPSDTHPPVGGTCRLEKSLVSPTRSLGLF